MFHHYCYFGTKIKETDDVKVHLYNHFDENGRTSLSCDRCWATHAPKTQIKNKARLLLLISFEETSLEDLSWSTPSVLQRR